MYTVIEGENFIEIRSSMPAGRRLVFFLLALFPLLAPYELLIRPDWQSIWHLFFVLAAVVSLGALVVSALLMWAALAGLNTMMRFDRADATVTYSISAPVVRRRTHRFPIDSITEVRVEEHDWSDGAPSYSLQVQLTDGRKFKTASTWSRERAEGTVQRVSDLVRRSSRV